MNNMATPPISEPIYYQHERRSDTNLITTELGTESPTVPWVIWKQNFMFEITRLCRIDESHWLSMTSQIFGTDCFLSTRYDSVESVSRENSLSYVDYTIAVCYKCFWVQMGREHDKLGGRGWGNRPLFISRQIPNVFSQQVEKPRRTNLL